MADRSGLFLANVTEAGDIVLYGAMLAFTLVVGLALFGIDTLVARLRDRRSHGGGKPPPTA